MSLSTIDKKTYTIDARNENVNTVKLYIRQKLSVIKENCEIFVYIPNSLLYDQHVLTYEPYEGRIYGGSNEARIYRTINYFQSECIYQVDENFLYIYSGYRLCLSSNSHCMSISCLNYEDEAQKLANKWFINIKDTETKITKLQGIKTKSFEKVLSYSLIPLIDNTRLVNNARGKLIELLQNYEYESIYSETRSKSYINPTFSFTMRI